MKISLLFLFLCSIVYAKDITVLEIDTGINPSHIEIRSHLINTLGDDYKDFHSHGTHIAGIILKNTCSQVKLISCKYYYEKWEYPLKNSNDCFKQAIDLKVDYVNYSSGGFGPNTTEKELLETLTKNGTIIVVAAGNEGKNAPEYYPAKYGLKGIIVVGNLQKNGKRHFLSNYGFKDMKWEIGTNVLSTFPGDQYGLMTGTSQAAAVHMNKLLIKRCSELK